MKSITLLTLLFSSSLWAIDPSACDKATEDGTKKCIQEVFTNVKDVGGSPVACGEENKDPAIPPLVKEFALKGDCRKFISTDEEGGYGPWGKEIIKYLADKDEESVFFREDQEGMVNGIKACPNWKDMNRAEKEHFWVWTFASIASIEASCKEKSGNPKATNGTAVGLMQLESRQSQRAWRGPNCNVNSVNDAKNNLRCGMDIMEELLKGKEGEYKGNGQLWGNKSSYWQHLKKKDGGHISDLIALNPFCKK